MAPSAFAPAVAAMPTSRRGPMASVSFPPSVPSAFPTAVQATYAMRSESTGATTATDTDDALDGELDDDDLDDDADDDTDDAALGRIAASGGGAKQPNDTAFARTTERDSSKSSPAQPPPVIRRRNVGVPKFLRFLYQILEQEDRDVIAWSHKGTAFQIRQPDELAETVLPKYFKHNKVSSFQRQLNYFGFKKWTKTQTTICTFSHPFFLRDDKDKMKLIKRKERIGPVGFASVGTDVSFSSLSSFGSEAGANSVGRPNGIGARELAMRRHSTGALALTASMMLNPSAMLPNRKRAGTVDLEFETQQLPMSSSSSSQLGLDVIKELGPRMPSRVKRKSLPHVMLPPTLQDRKGNQLFASSTDAFAPLVDMAARPFSAASLAVASGGYFGQQPQLQRVGATTASSSLKQDALSSAVLPVSSSEMMLLVHQPQQQHPHHPYLRQHSHPGAVVSSGSHYPHHVSNSSLKGENAIDMSDLSGPLQSVQSASMPPAPWNVVPNNFNVSMMAVHHHHHPSNTGGGSHASPFDPLPVRDYATHSTQLSGHQTLKLHGSQEQQQQEQPHQEDYLDILLESAAFNYQLGPQPPEPQPTGLPPAWAQHYQQQQQQHQLHAHQQQTPMGMPLGFVQQPMSHQHQQPTSHQQHQQHMSAALGNGQAHRF